MASRLANNVSQPSCPKCGRYIAVDYVGEFGVRFACSCARAESGCWTLPKNDVFGE